MKAYIVKAIIEAPIRQQMGLLSFLRNSKDYDDVELYVEPLGLPDGYLLASIKRADASRMPYVPYTGGISPTGEVST